MAILHDSTAGRPPNLIKASALARESSAVIGDAMKGLATFVMADVVPDHAPPMTAAVILPLGEYRRLKAIAEKASQFAASIS